MFAGMARRVREKGVYLAVLICVMALFAGVSALAGEVMLSKQDDGSITVKAPAYEALVAADGNVTSFRVGGKEWFNSKVSFSRGTYFYYQKTAQKLDQISQPEAQVVEVRNDLFHARYEFREDGMDWLVGTTAPGNTSFFTILDPATVQAVGDGADQLVAVAAKNNWPKLQWFGAGKVVTVTGHNGIWGPWHEMQVIQTIVSPGADKRMSFRIADMSADMAKKVSALSEGGTSPAKPTTAATASASAVSPGVRIEKVGENYTVTSPVYSATVEPDGCLTQIRFGGGNWLKPGVSISRGTYFYQNGAKKLENVAQAGANAITASSDVASVRYEFGEKNMTWEVENRTTERMTFFIIFDGSVDVVRNAKGEWAKVPTRKDWGGETTWFRKGYSIKARGNNRLWGPWNNTTVWEASLNGQEKRKITLEFAKASDAEKRKAATIAKVGTDKQLPAPEVKEADLVVLSPREYQVVQRRTAKGGDMVVSGRAPASCDSVRVRMSGKSTAGAWSDEQILKTIGKTGGFFGRVEVPAGGWYSAEFEALKDGKPVAKASVAHFGMGEVFVGAGQSNSTNCGQEKTQQTSGMVVAFSGRHWELANDPIPGCHDTSRGGSLWPAFGDAMYAKYKVPIGVAPTGHGGTSVMLWQPGDELFGWMMRRIQQLGPGGFRGVLWHQGESDVGRTSDDYYAALKKVIRASNEAAGWEFPWFVAQVSYHPKQSHYESTRSAQKRLWDDGVALEGPDTDVLGGDTRDHDGRGIHFSPKGLKKHGELWAEKVGAYLDEVLR